MLSSIRSAFSKGILRYFLIALMGLLVVSFAIWGIGDVVRSGGSRDVAKVGNIKITAPEFQATYQRETRMLSNRMQRPLTPADLTQIGLDRLVLNKLITDALLDSKVKDMKLSLSDAQIGERIVNSPIFKGESGQFDRIRFLEMLRELGYNEADYVANERKLALRQHLASSVIGLKQSPQTILAAVNAYRNEKRIVDFVTITAKDVGAPAIPTEDDLKKFYEERKLSFRAPDYRKATIIVATKETVDGAALVTDDEIKASYEKLKPAFTIPEKRTLERIRLANKEAKPFDDLIKEQNLTAEQLNYGTFTEGEIIDAPVAKAAFSLKIGEVSAPLDSTFGTIIIRVKAITPASIKPLDEVKDALKSQIGTERLRSRLYDIHDKLDKERASGLPLVDIAGKIGLKALQVETDITGLDTKGATVTLPERDLVLREIFDSALNAEREPITLKDQGGYIWVEVNAVTTSRERSFDEVKTDVTTRFIENQLRASIIALSDKIIKDVEAGATLEAASKQKPQTTGELTRFSNDQSFGQNALDAVFSTQVGRLSQAASKDLIDRLVFKVVEARMPTFDAAAPEAKELATNLVKTYEDDLLTQYIGALRKQYGVTIDEVNFKRAVGGKSEN